MEKGILLIACGNEQYLKMAEVLAVSIKQVDKNAIIAVAHNFENIDKSIFDKSIKLPKKSYITNGKIEWIKTKTYMYDLSPFAKTIFLDVDMVWLFEKPISNLFNELSGINWTMSNTGIAQYSIWADINEIKKLYKNAVMWNYHSEFVYFEKSDKTKEYFDRVKSIYENPKIEGTNFGGARIADELAFQLASIELNQYPHKENYTPIYWYFRDRKNAHLQPYKLSKQYYAFSVGGKFIPYTQKQKFEIIAKYQFAKSTRKYTFKLKDKMSFIPERRNI